MLRYHTKMKTFTMLLAWGEVFETLMPEEPPSQGTLNKRAPLSAFRCQGPSQEVLVAKSLFELETVKMKKNIFFGLFQQTQRQGCSLRK